MILQKYAQKAFAIGSVKTVSMERNICNVKYEDVIGYDQVNEVLNQQQIGATIISLYIRYFKITSFYNALRQFCFIH